jgi:hypothetical protein
VPNNEQKLRSHTKRDFKGKLKQAKEPVATCDAQYTLYEKLKKKMFQCFPCVRQSLIKVLQN